MKYGPRDNERQTDQCIVEWPLNMTTALVISVANVYDKRDTHIKTFL